MELSTDVGGKRCLDRAAVLSQPRARLAQVFGEIWHPIFRARAVSVYPPGPFRFVTPLSRVGFPSDPAFHCAKAKAASSAIVPRTMAWMIQLRLAIGVPSCFLIGGAYAAQTVTPATSSYG